MAFKSVARLMELPCKNKVIVSHRKQTAYPSPPSIRYRGRSPDVLWDCSKCTGVWGRSRWENTWPTPSIWHKIEWPTYIAWQFWFHNLTKSHFVYEIAVSFTLNIYCLIMYQWNRSFNIPPGNPPGILIFEKFFFKFPPPPPRGRKAVQMPLHRSIPGDQMPPPPGNFSVAFIVLRREAVYVNMVS